MKKASIRFAAVALALSLFACATAEKTTDYQISKVTGLLWKVESQTATVYLLGSIHFATDDFYPLNSKIEEAFEKSDVLTLEADISKANPFELMQAASYQDDRTWKDELSDELIAKVEKALDKYNLPSVMYDKMKPWFIALSISAMQAKSKGFDEKKGIDVYFSKKAKKSGKDIFELESVKEQLAIFDEKLKNHQEEFLKLTLTEGEESLETLDSMANYWKEGNVEALEKELFSDYLEKEEYEPIYDALYSDRNKKMTKKIREYLKTNKTYFIVVGAAHLIGKEGIVKLIK